MISMTGFAARRGAGVGYSWTWDLRSVNGKGLDLRLRVPDWIDGLEAMLNAALAAVGRVELAGMALGVTLRQATAADVLTLRGVIDASAVETDTTSLRQVLLADLPALLAEYHAMRASEGRALAAVLTAQLDRIATLTSEAQAETVNRAASQAATLREGVVRVLAATDAVDPARLAQELALLAVKTDVTEELDRLTAHVAAARAHLAEGQPAGRKLDFLMQEFMREANTLCSKAQSLALTRIGLDLKTVIDQMREQVQNVE